MDFALLQIWDVASPDGDRPSFNFGAGVNFDMDSNRLTPKCRFKSDQVGLLLLPEPALELKGKWRVFDSPLAVDVKYQCPVTNFTRFWESPAKVRVRFFNANHAGLHITPVGERRAPSVGCRGHYGIGFSRMDIRNNRVFSDCGKVYSRVWDRPVLGCREASQNPRMHLFRHSRAFLQGSVCRVLLSFGPGVEFEDRDLKLGKYASLRVAAAVDFPRQLPLEEGDQALNVRVSRLGLKARIN